jgi:hypothetical protein
LLDYENERDGMAISVGGLTGYGGGVRQGLANLYDIERLEIEALPGSRVEVIDSDPNDVLGDIEIVFNGTLLAPGDPYWFV